MANWKSLIDNSLAKDFDKKPYDPVKGRNKAIAMLDKVSDQYSNGSTKAPNRMWKVGGNDSVRFEPKLAGSPLLLDGQEVNHIPKERFLDFLAGVKGSVEKGELDDAIKAALESEGGSTGRRSAKKSSGEKPWTVRKDWAELSTGDKQSIGRYYSNGKNPDGSDISEVGHKPDAPIVRAVKPAK